MIRLCFPEECHLIEIISSSGRLSLRFFWNLVMFLFSLCFVCVWIGIVICITECQSARRIESPFRYIYFAYQMMLNVGYGDTKEESILSFIVLISMTLIGCSILIIFYQKLIEDLKNSERELICIETWSHQSFVEDLLRQMKRVRRKPNDETVNTSCSSKMK